MDIRKVNKKRICYFTLYWKGDTNMRIDNYISNFNYYDLAYENKKEKQNGEQDSQSNEVVSNTGEKDNSLKEEAINKSQKVEKAELTEETGQDTIEKKNEEGKQLIAEINKLSKIFDEEDDSECTSVTEKVVKEFKRKQKAERIAAKVARGQNITESERRYLQAKHPELLDKSYKINRARKEAEIKIKNAKTKEEARQIIMNARQSGIMISMSSLNDKIGESELTGKVIGKAVDKLDTDTKHDIKKKEEKENKKIRKKRKIMNTINQLI